MTPSLLARVHEALQSSGIPSALIGAAALAVYGVSRSTMDQDLLVTDRAALDRRVWAGLDATVDIRRGDADDPLAGVVRISSPDERDVDVVIGRYAWQSQILQEAGTVRHPPTGIPVASPEGLVLLKLYAGGAQDLWDVQQLRAAVGPSLDAAVDRLVDVLPAASRDAWRQLTHR